MVGEARAHGARNQLGAKPEKTQVALCTVLLTNGIYSILRLSGLASGLWKDLTRNQWLLAVGIHIWFLYN